MLLLMEIEQHDDRIDGKVSKGQDLLVFDKDNTKITYKTSKTCTLTGKNDTLFGEAVFLNLGYQRLSFLYFRSRSRKS